MNTTAKIQKLVKGILIVVFMFFLVSKLNAKNDTIVVINTSMGMMKFRLYDDTPIHKNQFMKLVSSGFYDSLLFHRVIKDLMIQAGEADLRYSPPSKANIIEEPECVLKQEVNPKRFHKKGALAAVTQNNETSEDKLSSICQFYIVLGKKFSERDFQLLETRRESQLKQKLISKYLSKPENMVLHERYKLHQNNRNNDSLNAIRQQLQPIIEMQLNTEKIRKFTNEERRVYSTLGGSPHLDGNYTVFGELFEGWDILDKIAAVEVIGNGKPKTELRIQVYFEVEK